jgi:hypothetical protein
MIESRENEHEPKYFIIGSGLRATPVMTHTWKKFGPALDASATNLDDKGAINAGA